MLLYFLIICCSIFLFSKSLPLKPLSPWTTEESFLTLWFFKELSYTHIMKSIKATLFPQIQSKMSFKRVPTNPNAERTEPASAVAGGGEMSVLDLPELVLECILQRLSPSGLCNMAGVCSSLRERCVSDHLWEKHMKQKWGKVLGPAAYREWQWHIASRHDCGNPKQRKHKGFARIHSLIRSLPWILLRSNTSDGDNCGNNKKQKSSASLPVDSIMNWYLALDTGRFWFPAQVYNRENGHVGFMLSCYDAELSYDQHTDSFQARYPPHGRKAVAIETGVTWERIRVPPIDTSPHDLHVSDCLNELKPGDHFEIQWRRNKEFPYGWWYGVVGHLESCDGNENRCRCHQTDTVILEFNQYTPGSRWRRTAVNRKDHREEGNEAEGFYGGIRKLRSEEEIAAWRRLWPNSILE